MKGSSAERAFLSVIVPNHNGAKTIGKCLEALFSNRYDNFEVIAVDDASSDDSVEIIKRYPCRLVSLAGRSGAAAARNAGAREARGDALFFIDSDCVVREDTLDVAVRAFYTRPQTVTGGTYSPIAHDGRFFSTFQALFVNYSETKHPRPDYVATHAMIISRELFEQSGGFDEDFMPILEDVEFSHRVRMEPTLQVEHIFDYSLWGSLRNAFRKSFYWTMYSIRNRDLFRDSGTASVELKSDVVSWFACAVLLALFLVTGQGALLVALAATCGLNLFVNMNFIRSMARAAGVAFTLGAVLYYTALYPLPVAAGGLLGALRS
jgi:GT2 family glycosyltransferase